jgi:hypothetical protein
MQLAHINSCNSWFAEARGKDSFPDGSIRRGFMSVAGQQTRKVDDASAGARYDVDVLVIGGGPAGTWAAISAAARGARVMLADKGYCGTSGATAPAGTALWYVTPDGDARSRAKASRFAMGGALAEHTWMDRVTWLNYGPRIPLPGAAGSRANP